LKFLYVRSTVNTLFWLRSSLGCITILPVEGRVQGTSCAEAATEIRLGTAIVNKDHNSCIARESPTNWPSIYGMASPEQAVPNLWLFDEQKMNPPFFDARYLYSAAAPCRILKGTPQIHLSVISFPRNKARLSFLSLLICLRRTS
jgi:hypothetical protein